MTIAFVQKATATGVNATSITTPAFGSNTTSGNVLVATGANTPGGSALTYTFSDSKSNTWATKASVNKSVASGNSAAVAIGAASLTTAGASHTVTLTPSGGTGGMQLVASEYSGLTTTLDSTAGTATQGSSTTSIAPVTGSTTNGNDLIVAVMCGDTNTTAVGMSNPPTINGSTTGVTSLEFVSATTIVAIESAYLITSSTGTMTASWSYTSDSTGGYAAAVIALQGTAGGNVTVALTGQSATMTAGSLSPSTSSALTGQSATFSLGTLVPGLSVALLGQSGSFTSGLLAPSTSVALAGQSAIFTSGTITASSGGDITVSLTGQVATLTAGTLTPALSVSLSGQPVTLSAGTLTPSSSIALTGVSISGSAGSLSPSIDVPLQGQSITSGAGQLGVVGDVTVALTGASAVFAAGQLSAIVSGGDTHDLPLPKRRRFDDSAQTQVIRESQLKPKKTRAPKPTQPPPKAVKDMPEDEDILAQLLAAEDQAIASTIEEAMTLLKTLH